MNTHFKLHDDHGSLVIDMHFADGYFHCNSGYAYSVFIGNEIPKFGKCLDDMIEKLKDKEKCDEVGCKFTEDIGLILSRHSDGYSLFIDSGKSTMSLPMTKVEINLFAAFCQM